MLGIHDEQHRPRLLVSVRNADEALAALAGGADVIDVKEPDHGSLGAADSATIADIVAAVGGRALVTAATGELIELQQRTRDELARMMPDGVSLAKIGLAGCGNQESWPAQWRETFATLLGSQEESAPKPVAVVYADWRTAQAPAPDDVLDAAVQFGCPALLIDTWDKSAGSLFDHWSSRETSEFVAEIQAHQMIAVLAGSLNGESLAQAVRLRPDVVAVRTAACDDGRRGNVSTQRVEELRSVIDRLITFTNPLSIT